MRGVVMKKEMKRFLAGSVAILSLVVAGCSQTTSTSESAKETTQVAAYHKTDVTGPASSFDWNATVDPATYEKVYVETRTKEKSTLNLSELKKAAESLEEKKKTITDKKVLTALSLVDAVFVDQRNFDKVVKAAGASNQEEFFDNFWNGYMVDMLSKLQPPFSNDEVFEYQGEKYPLKVYAPMFFKVNTNALGKAGAYNLEDYKVEGDMVYLKFAAPSIDASQYYVRATYRTDKEEFFEGLWNEHDRLIQENYAKGLNVRFVLQLAALDFKADNYVSLRGMDYLPDTTHYLAIKVDDQGNATMDDTNLANLLQINMRPANNANKVKFK